MVGRRGAGKGRWGGRGGGGGALTGGSVRLRGRAVGSGQPYDIELRQRGADSGYRWFRAQGLPVRDAEGQIIRWCVLQTDIDERKRSEEALRQMEEMLRSTRRKLSAAMQIATVAELSASIDHEVNQPLASVVTNAHACQTWLLHDPPNLDRAQATLERIIRDGHSAAEVVRRIRALFKEAAPVKALLDMNQVVAGVLRVLSDALRDTRIRGSAELGGDLPMNVVYGVCMVGFACSAVRSLQVAILNWRRGYSILERPEIGMDASA